MKGKNVKQIFHIIQKKKKKIKRKPIKQDENKNKMVDDLVQSENSVSS